ncbi:MAG: hypothetical protein JWO36_2242 [Myxococcales bacterium]|nr:hypothetical protein [Myxococcales bacterium]
MQHQARAFVATATRLDRWALALVLTVTACGDNRSMPSAACQDKPDLVVLSVTMTPASPAQGPFTFSAEVQNVGAAATPDGVVIDVAFLVDGVEVTWSDTDVAALAPDAIVTLTANNGTSGAATFTASAGTHTLAAVVNETRQFAECSTTNNAATTQSFDVPPSSRTRFAAANTHFRQGIGDPTKALDALKAAGMNSFRDEATLNPNDLLHQAVDLAISPAYGMQPLLVLDSGVGSASQLPTVAPQVVQRYGTKVIYEVWNEWNNWPGTSAAKGSVASWADYTTMLCATYHAMKAVNPDVIIIGGGGVWLTDPHARDGIFNNGGENCMDAFSIHPYWAVFKGPTNGSGTNVMAAMTTFHDYILTKTGKDLPFYVTEEGWSTATADPNAVATYLHDYFVAAQTVPFLKGIWWYELSNAGPPGREFEYGLMEANYTPKPAYNAMQQVAPTF